MTVTVAEKKPGTFFDQSPLRYGFNGSFSQWQRAYGAEGMNFHNAYNYWNQVHSAAFASSVIAADRAEAARIAVEKMMLFMGHFPTIAGFGMGAGGVMLRLPSARGFGFSSPVGGAKMGGANPFKGKTFDQIDRMFKAKGFVPKGVDPSKGKGSYFNPRSGTRYYLDKGGQYKKGFEGPHVDIWYNGHPSFGKVKFFLDGSPKMYSPLK